MLESSFHNLVAVDCLPDPLVVQLQRFTASLIEQGYADETVQWKVKRVTDFGQWLKQKGVAVADLDEALVAAERTMQADRARLSKACCSPTEFAALHGAPLPVPVDCPVAPEVR